jgi:hypothetical protein
VDGHNPEVGIDGAIEAPSLSGEDPGTSPLAQVPDPAPADAPAAGP